MIRRRTLLLSRASGVLGTVRRACADDGSPLRHVHCRWWLRALCRGADRCAEVASTRSSTSSRSSPRARPTTPSGCRSGDIDIGLVSGEVMYEWLPEHPRRPKLRVVSVIYSTPGMFAVRPDTPLPPHPRSARPAGRLEPARHRQRRAGALRDAGPRARHGSRLRADLSREFHRRADHGDRAAGRGAVGQRLSLAGLHRAHQPAGRRALHRADPGGDRPDPRQVSVPRRAHGAGRPLSRPVRAAHHGRRLELHPRPARPRRRDRLSPGRSLYRPSGRPCRPSTRCRRRRATPWPRSTSLEALQPGVLRFYREAKLVQ